MSKQPVCEKAQAGTEAEASLGRAVSLGLTWCFVTSKTNQRGFQPFSRAPLLYNVPSKDLEEKTKQFILTFINKQ